MPPAHPARWFGAFAFHLHGSAFSLGPKATEGSDYVGVKREIYRRLTRAGPDLQQEVRALLEGAAGWPAGM